MKINISLSSAPNIGILKAGLVKLGKEYHKSIPMQEIWALAQDAGLIAIDEDGSPWEGFLTGRDGRASIELADHRDGKTIGKFMHLQWHKMPSGKYEINAYTD